MSCENVAHEYESDIALRHYKDFKLKVIATLQGDVWTLTRQDIHLVMNTLKP